MDGERKEAADFRGLKLKPDHKNRPIWVCPNRTVILETFSPIYKHAYDFLIAIAEPQSRPDFFHTYVITDYSLYAAASIGLTTEEILGAINRFSKNELDPKIEKFIRDKTEKCGKVRLVLKENRLFVESMSKGVLLDLLRSPVIADARILRVDDPDVKIDNDGFRVERRGLEGVEIAGMEDRDLQNLQREAMGLSVNAAPERALTETVVSFEVESQNEKVEHVKQSAQKMGYPMLEEYDFRRDKSLPDLNITLRPIAKHRGYQEKSLSKMFGNGRARSGMIVLPCGAGKTLVGITACATVKKSCLILCDRGLAVSQWKAQLTHWTSIDPDRVIRWKKGEDYTFPEDGCCIIIATYHMIAYTGKRSAEGKIMMDYIQNREWGLLVLDEVHVAPAEKFRTCASVIQSKSKLGLTATLVREDGKTSDLYYLIGPKLYEANWLDLERSGYLAKVQCLEIWCPMTSEFYEEYLNEPNHRKRELLHTFNPSKYRTCQYLINLHEQRGDKVLVFSDSIPALEYYARTMKRPYLHGKTAEVERQEFISRLNDTNTCSTLMISSVGDTSLDMPDINVVIQISSTFGSRRKEAQRLGRILRPKPRRGDEYNAFFYELVSKDTTDMKNAAKRQRFIVNQGYSFHVITNLVDDETPGLGLSKSSERVQLLAHLKRLQKSVKAEKELAKNKRKGRLAARQSAADRRMVSGAALAGDDGGLIYEERAAPPRPKKRRRGLQSSWLKNTRKRVAKQGLPSENVDEFGNLDMDPQSRGIFKGT